MKIVIDPKLMARLLCYAVATENEFSGFGFCERKDGDIHMYDFVLLDVGSYGYTQTDPKTMLPLFERPDRKNMKIWLHRHPIGNGIPGPHNWSGRDELTIRSEPMGSSPQDIQWSVSIVITPAGFVGRIDNYLKGITQHLEVEPKSVDFFAEVRSLERSSWARTSTQDTGTNSHDLEEEDSFPSLETSGRETWKRKRKTKTTAKKSSTASLTGKKSPTKKKSSPRSST
jgi:hypothetical protein